MKVLMSACRGRLMTQTKPAHITALRATRIQNKSRAREVRTCVVAGEVGKVLRSEIEIKSNTGFVTNSMWKKKICETGLLSGPASFIRPLRIWNEQYIESLLEGVSLLQEQSYCEMQLGKKRKKKNLKPTYCSALSWMKPKCSAYRYQSACWFTQHAHTPGRNFCWDFCLYTVATGRPGWANVRQRQSETFSWAPYQLLLVNNQSSDSDWGCKIEPLFHENQTSPLVAADILTDLCYHHH